MAVTMNQFHCQNGHSFEANAKLRTRCPECGVSTKRSFEKVIAAVVKPPDLTPEPVKEPEPKVKTGPVLIRQGRTRMAVKKPPVKSVAKKRPIGAKVLAAGLVKSHTIKTRGTMPTIKRHPVKTAVARGIQGHEQTTPYWHQVARDMGF